MDVREDLLHQLIATDPRLAALGPGGLGPVVDRVVEAELYRRGVPDPTSGAYHLFALTQGALLKPEYDLSTHAHHPAWTLGAVAVDPISLIGLNQAHGFEAGDWALRELAEGLRELFPRAKRVRVHADAIAALLPPSAEVQMSAELGPRTVAALTERLGAGGKANGFDWPARFTVALLELQIVQPSSWQVLGPLAWAEVERALTLAKRGAPPVLLRRRIDLQGAIDL
jgi:hypothetical protein